MSRARRRGARRAPAGLRDPRHRRAQARIASRICSGRRSRRRRLICLCAGSGRFKIAYEAIKSSPVGDADLPVAEVWNEVFADFNGQIFWRCLRRSTPIRAVSGMNKASPETGPVEACAVQRAELVRSQAAAAEGARPRRDGPGHVPPDRCSGCRYGNSRLMNIPGQSTRLTLNCASRSFSRDS